MNEKYRYFKSPIMANIAETMWNQIKDLSVDDAERIIATLFRQNTLKAYKKSGFKMSDERNGFYGDNAHTDMGVDHPSKIWNGKTHIHIFEPYGLEMENLEKLIVWCKKNKKTFRINGDSPHFAGRTVRVYITKNESK